MCNRIGLSVLYTPTINEDEKSIKAVIRLAPDSDTDTPTSRRNQPLRQSVLKNNAKLSRYKEDLPSSDEESNNGTPKSGRRNIRRTYFTPSDSEEFTADEDELVDSDDGDRDDDENLGSSVSDEDEEATPKAKTFQTPDDFGKLPLTPDVLQHVKGTMRVY